MTWCLKPIWSCAWQPDFLEKSFAPKIGKMGQKQGFWNILKNLVINFYWICSLMKIYNIFYVPVQIPYLGRFLFLRYGPKCSQPIRLQNFLINHISRTNKEIAWFFACWYNKSWLKKFWIGVTRNGCGQSGHRTQLAVPQEWIDEMNWFLHGGVNSGKQTGSFSSWDHKICWISLWI